MMYARLYTCTHAYTHALGPLFPHPKPSTPPFPCNCRPASKSTHAHTPSSQQPGPLRALSHPTPHPSCLSVLCAHLDHHAEAPVLEVGRRLAHDGAPVLHRGCGDWCNVRLHVRRSTESTTQSINQSSKQASKPSIHQSIKRASKQASNRSIRIAPLPKSRTRTPWRRAS